MDKVKKGLPIKTILFFLFLTYVGFTVGYGTHLHNQMRKAVKEHALIISGALWDLDQEGIGEYLDAVTFHYDYASLVINDQDGSVFFEISPHEPSLLNKILIDIKLIPLVPISSEISFDGRVIGRISALWRCKAIYPYAYVFLITLLFFLVINLYNRILTAKYNLEITVEERTSDLRNAYKVLKESEEKYRLLINNYNASIVVFDIDSTVLIMNPAAAEGMNGKPEDFIGRKLSEYLPNGEYLTERNHKIIKSGKPADFEDEIELPSGKRWLWSNLQPVKDVNGKPYALQVISYDITDRKRTENELREKDYIIESAASIIATTDLEGHMTYANPAFLNAWGYDEAEEFLGRHFSEFWIVEDRLDVIMQALFENGNWSAEIQARRKDGTLFHVHVSAAMVYDAEGNPVALMSTSVNISERIKAEEALKRYADTQAVLLREVNHRVKNNLAAIIGMLLKEQDRAEAAGITAYLDILGDLIARIDGLSTVHSMLSASGWSPLLLTELCEHVIHAALKSIPLDKKTSVHVETSSIRVSSNQAHHLTLVINELATNFVKHALGKRNTAGIRVGISREGEMPRIVLKDDGPGYPEEMLEGDFSHASVGFDLIFGIVKESLRGNVLIENNNGAVTTIVFKLETVDKTQET